MKRSSRLLTGLLLAGALVTAPQLFGQEQEEQQSGSKAGEAIQPKTVDLTGTVTITKDDNGLITAATLTVGEEDETEIVAIKLDMKGKKLAWTAPEDKRVKVTGIITESDGNKTITVQQFSVLPEEPDIQMEE